MNSLISYTKYPDGQNTYNGGSFLSNDKVATAGCSGTTCNVLAANSVFSNGQGAPLASNQSGGMSTPVYKVRKGGKSKKRRHSRKMRGGRWNEISGFRTPIKLNNGGASKRRSHKRRHSRKMRGGRRNETPSFKLIVKGGASKRRSHKRRHSKKRRSHKRRHSRKMKGGVRSPPAVSPAVAAFSAQKGGGTQLMNNICHSSGYSIGPVGTELKPTDVGLAALHYAPYTNTQNNNFSNII